MTVNDLPPFKVTIVGGSYAGLSVLQNVLRLNNGDPLIQALPPGSGPELSSDARVHRGIHITLIDERDGFFNTIGAPLAHVTRPYVQTFWRRFLDIKALQRPDITILQASLKHVDSRKRRLIMTDVVTGVNRTETYDYLVLATGLKRDFPITPSSLSKDQYLQEAEKHIDAIEKAKGGTAVVIGGGKIIIFTFSHILCCQPLAPKI
jgi:NADPH-dependent 2,4-dienoyl-CoA reductase/sulfur reductase-like enzyme